MPILPENCTLIISTYNWPEALELCLISLLQQSKIPAEIIIADDGSRTETKDLIERYKLLFPTKLIHLWHEDHGFRLAMIRNKAFALSTKEYIIQIDGDIVLHPKFIEDHLRFAEPNALLQGSRVMLGANRSKKMIVKKNSNVSFFQADIKRRENILRLLPLARYLSKRYRNRYPVYFARGANMSFWKKDLLEVNGYDELFEGWGHEDSDLTLRLLNKGKIKMILKFSAIAYHLHHPEKKSPEQEKTNRKRLEETFKHKITWAKEGITKHLPQS